VGLSEDRPFAGSDSPERYHLYCQWQMEEQLARLSGCGAGVADEHPLEAGGSTAGLFLDLPLGVHPGGFDTWRWPDLFVSGASAGAPPDSFFTRGQDWDSPPLHPERIRDQGHQYFARCLRHHMRHARFLRIDHVMSLHRLFWVPEGRDPADGVYVTYPSDELYALLCLESVRNQTVVVGEDLGTVPAGVRASMRRRGVLGTWVLQSSLRPRAAQPVDRVPRHVVAGLGTHDMYPFAGFIRGDDIRARMEKGRLDEAEARREIAARLRLVAKLAVALSGRAAGQPQAHGTEPASAAEAAAEVSSRWARTGEAGLLRRTLTSLGASEAAMVLVNLEDLLLATRPQNLPGTGADAKNWRGKMTGTASDMQRAIVELGRWLTAGKNEARRVPGLG
jgi:4-alpha-glucanotransferase